MLTILNLIPIGALVWIVWQAYKGGTTHDRVDAYFQKYRQATNRKFHNFFGIPSADL
jgi:hypothetical protein